jgi:hypothetical protein
MLEKELRAVARSSVVSNTHDISCTDAYLHMTHVWVVAVAWSVNDLLVHVKHLAVVCIVVCRTVVPPSVHFVVFVRIVMFH